MFKAASLDPMVVPVRRAVLIAYDAVIWVCAVLTALTVRYLDVEQAVPWSRGATAAAVAFGAQTVIGTLMWLYDGRYVVGSKDEALHLGGAVIGAGIVMGTASVTFPEGRLVPLSITLGATALAITGCIGGRLVWRLFHESSRRPGSAKPALIFGAGSAGAELIRSLLHDPTAPYYPVGLLDDDPKKRHIRIEGVRMMGNRTHLAAAVAKSGADALIVAVPSATPHLFRDLSAAAQPLGLKVKVLPKLETILDGPVRIRDIRDIEITDVLGRSPVDTDVDAIAGYLKGRRILVTGAGGSIGAELCRQISKFQPERLFMLDRDESALHSLKLSLTGSALMDTDDVILCDIRDAEALTAIFSSRRPHVVFHAAALKHLPMLEQYPDEAWKTNVLGTRNVLVAADQVGVDVMVNISTDKAANPCSVLGYSKRIAERLTAGMALQSGGKFVSVRFGNVLGSRGSVLTAFAEQVASGGPVTVTDPEVTRYFMMIPEACELVIQAAAVGEDGQALVLEMGKPVRILDVAQQIIDLSGRKDVEIVFTGLREGEKMHEELFGDEEVPRTTSHKLVRAVEVPALDIASVSPVDWDLALTSEGI